MTSSDSSGMVGNSRLLFQEIAAENFSQWFTSLCDLDAYIFAHQRLHLATEQCHLYFFTTDASEMKPVWCAREVIGFEGHLPESMSFFDSHAGEALSTAVEEKGQDLLTLENYGDMFDLMMKAREQWASLSLANTWRLSFLWKNEEKESPLWPKMTFQFFKNL